MCEGQCREGMDAEVCMCVAGSKAVPPDWRGSVSKSKGRDLCACKEKGDYKCVCVYMHKGLGFSSLLFPHASLLKKGVQRSLSTKHKQSKRTASFSLHHLPRRDIEKGKRSSPTQAALHR